MVIRLFWFVIVYCLATSCDQSDKHDSQHAFATGEHVNLGALGFDLACRGENVCRQLIKTKDRTVEFTYGEIVAYSGDFYLTPEAIYNQNQVGALSFQRNDLDTLRSNVGKELKVIHQFLESSAGDQPEYPTFDTLNSIAMPDYLFLALMNQNHFGFNNMLHYIKYHDIAIEKALKANELKSPQLFDEALFYNGFADHFLTDGFASGHIRVPRSQIMSWAKSRLISDKVSGIFSKILHDLDGEMRHSRAAHGLPVVNSRGDRWYARCDAQLFWDNKLADQSIQLPIEAVRLSVREVIDAYVYGKKPQGIYAATMLVPFPDEAKVKPLSKTFHSQISEDKVQDILDSLPFYLKLPSIGVNQENLKFFFSEFPQIEKDFYLSNWELTRQNFEIGKRLPKTYIDAYTKR